MQALRFGVFDHMDDAGRGTAVQYDERLKLTEVCDVSGFYCYHLAEHHGTPHGLAPSPNLFLAAVAQRTRRIRLGPMVMLLNFYHPLRAYEEIAMLDQLSNGRLDLGVGRGSSPAELGFYGVDVASSQCRYLEAADVVMKAIRGGSLTFQGHHFKFSDVPLTPSLVENVPPPLWVGVMSADTARYAAEIGANVACIGTASHIRQLRDIYHEYQSCDQRPPAQEPLLGMVRQVVVADTDAKAEAIAAPAFDRWYHTFTYLTRERGQQIPPRVSRTFNDAVDSGMTITGSIETVTSTLAEQISKARVNYVLFQLAFGNLPLEASKRTARAIASCIMPEIHRKMMKNSRTS
jgi:alkanesulfonate monooxygenase SsuD/methylene tetrahydromethanopterin reductase-like flavin-dependent oxidoreductase (luciferase family)